MKDGDPSSWTTAAQDSMPPANELVEIDLGNEERSDVRRARLKRGSFGHYWKLEPPARGRILEPRIVNRLAYGEVWRWRRLAQTP